MRNKICNKRVLGKIFVCLMLLWTGIIFSFSLQPAEVSDGTSMGLVRKVVEIFLPWLTDELERLPVDQLKLLNHIVRKGAHFTEYMILGILSSAAFICMKYKNKIALSIGYCVLAASLDETIQLFVAGRAGRVTDVMIDSAGAVVGVLVISFIRNLRKK